MTIAVDGGYRAFQSAGLSPQVLLGDFDSLDQVLPTDPSIRLEPRPDQEHTDLEKALDFCNLQPEDLVTILGGSGQRSDHFLNNLIIAAGVDQDIQLSFESNTELIHRVTKGSPFTNEINPSNILSIIPLGRCDSVTTSGLEWNLETASLGPGLGISQSNRVKSNPVTISIGSGILYLVIIL
jgi:thiamine pyrophosphokinase